MRKTLFPLLALCLLLSGCGETPAADASVEFFAMDTVMRLETPGLSDPAAVTAGRAAHWHVFLTAPGHNSVAAVASFYVHFCIIIKHLSTCLYLP